MRLMTWRALFSEPTSMSASSPRIRRSGSCTGRPSAHGSLLSVSRSSIRPGLILVQISAQLEPCLTQENTLHTLNTPLTWATPPLRAPPIP